MSASRIELGPSIISERVDQVCRDPLYWFGVRHHSPTAARHLEAAVQARRPQIVFIEGPYEANHLLPFIVDGKTVPPVAIYSSYRDDENAMGLNGIRSASVDIPVRSAAWYPLTAYSPEYVAIQAAFKLNAEVVFIDLPHYAVTQVGYGTGLDSSPESPAQREQQREWETLVSASRFYQSLAIAGGYKSWNEAWDSLFENPKSSDYESYRREIASFCCAVRMTTDKTLESHLGTIERERHFMKVIRETLSDRGLTPENAMVVCGGYHLFMDRDDQNSPPPIPTGTKYCTVVPYSFFRISELTGYGAGNRAPQFYQTCFEMTAEGRDEHIVLEHSIAVLRQMRKGGEPLSTADAIAITHHAKMLARLRGKNHATLDDIEDAIVTCCCKGDPNEEGIKLRTAMDTAGIGTKIGKVSDRLGRLPIVADFHDQISELELGELLAKEKKLSVRLDKRVSLDAKRSRFFHRMVFLDVPFAALTSTGGDFSGTLFREDWQLKWDPKTEPALIEQNLYGDTIERASLNRLRDVIAALGEDAGKTCHQLLQAVQMDLPDLVRDTELAALSAIERDASFSSLTIAMKHLAVLERLHSFQGLRGDSIEPMLNRCYQRACFSLGASIAVPEEEQMEVISGLTSIADILQRSSSSKLDRDLFVNATSQASHDTPVPFLRGAFIGLLCELRELPAEALAREVAGLAHASPELMVTAGELLDGMLATSRTSILLGADLLVSAVDDLLVSAGWEAFLVMLPRLRAAFERLPSTSRHSLAATVAKRYGLGSSLEVGTIHSSLGATALVAKLDAAVAAILREWPL